MKKARITMPISTALTQDKRSYLHLARRLGDQSGKTSPAFVLTELIVVLVIISLMTAIAMIALTPLFGRTKFKRQAREFINILQLAQNGAAESDRRYAVALDFDEQTYTLRQFTTLDHERILEDEPIIAEGHFTDEFRLEYIIFDDGVDTRYPEEGQEVFRIWLMAGHSGWQNGAILVLSDIDYNLYSIVINRLSRVIRFYPEAYELGELGFLKPKKANELFF